MPTLLPNGELVKILKMKHFTLIVFFLTSFTTIAQVHIHQLGDDFDPKEIGQAKIHKLEPSLIKAQYQFQEKVFSKAKVEGLVQSLDFEQKEDLLEVLEDEDTNVFVKKYPQFNTNQARALKAALYE